MKFNIEDFIDKHNYSDEIKDKLKNFSITKVVYKEITKNTTIYIDNDYILDINIINDLKNYFNSFGIVDFNFIFSVNNDYLNIRSINEHINYLKDNFSFLKNAFVTLYDKGFDLCFYDYKEYEISLNFLDQIILYFYNLGYHKTIDSIYCEEVIEELEEREALPEVKETKKKREIVEYKKINVEDLKGVLYDIKITVQIMKVEERGRGKNLRIYFYVRDNTDACISKFKKSIFKNQIVNKIKPLQWVELYGNYVFDEYANEFYFSPKKIEFIDDPYPLIDDAIEKRVELHAHSKYSEMDGVSSPYDLVKAANEMGHRAIALTDHLCVQGFHELFEATKEINPDADFKSIYGCELNMVYPHLNIVYNCKDCKLIEQEYVAFDLETTGLSNEYDSIIEFGAVIIYKGEIKERKDFFIKPPIELSEKTKELTHISENDLKDAKPFKDVKDDILGFIKDRILVAHNASFDFGFLNSELKRIGEKPLKNSVIDTLDLSRSLFKDRRNYKLGNIAKQYNVDYNDEDAHRADYDAEVLACIFNLMLKDLYKQGINTLQALNDFQDEEAFVKNRAFHTTVLCKNQEGLKDLYKIISTSHIDNLAVFGKANTKSGEESEYIAEPRIFKENLNKYRKNLLIGSACYNGEVFETASTLSKEKLAEVISFYDYIEVQPLENYRFLYEDKKSFTKERLQSYLKDIIDEALKQNKIVVATGDIHYVKKEQKLLREIYVNAPGLGGSRHPLYLFKEEARSKQNIPDQHFFNTKEMLDSFSWLKDENLINDIVIKNPNKIVDMIDKIKPFDKVLHPPKVLDAIKVAHDCSIYEEPFLDSNEIISADEYLERLVWYKAHQEFGAKIPSIIEERINKELNGIISNGYGVIYYTCHLLVKRSNDEGYIVGSRGSVGSSYVATLSGITEVNPLPPYYLCPKCHHFEFIENALSGYDVKDKPCPECGSIIKGEGQNIPFETFMGFKGDKIPDIDLNFSGEYQPKAHLFTREIFGEKNVFRAGTVSKVKEKTAFGYLNRYLETKKLPNISENRALKQAIATDLTGVKRTTGQHAGGIVVLPDDMEIEEITPIQYPANDKEASWYSTHYEYHYYNDNLLKFDILGHVDPTAMRMLSQLSGVDVKTIPLNDPEVISIFYSTRALKIKNPEYHEETGACGIPEFGTANTRRVLEETRPKTFSELVQISGLTHGTNVWSDNAQELIKNGVKLQDVIGCRDDIMGTLMSYGIEPLSAFNIMEAVRKGKVATGECDKWNEYEKILNEHKVPKWYIESCTKIRYMFPKAHAVAYCIMAVRVAWFKVYRPACYYASYLSLRCDAYELETMIKDINGIVSRLNELQAKAKATDIKQRTTDKEDAILSTLEICYEMASRGFRISNLNLNESLATEFKINPKDEHELIPPFSILDGLGENVARSIVEARNECPFLHKEDLMKRTLLSNTLLAKFEELHVLDGLEESSQISLF